MTQLCVPIFVETLEQTKRDISAALEAGAGTIELRLDTQTEPSIARNIVSEFESQFILTCRPEFEGGRSTLWFSQEA